MPLQLLRIIVNANISSLVSMVNAINRWEIFSLTRFFLAFIVFSTHAKSASDNPGPLLWVERLGPFEAILGFLLISGFSIGKSILRNSDSYFKRRIQRIYPVFLVCMLITYLITPQPLNIGVTIFLVLNLLFLNQLFTSTSFVGPAWTLSLEVWLYALAPVLVKLPYKTLIIIVYSSLVTYCLYTAGRTLFHWPYYAGTNTGINLLLLSYVWIAGFALAVFSDKAKQMATHIGVLLTIHFVTTCAIQTASRVRNHEFQLLIQNDLLDFAGKAICLLGIFIVVVSNPAIPALSLFARRVFNLLGNVSYPLYLSHIAILELCLKLDISHWLLQTVACLFSAYLIYELFDFYTKRRETKQMAFINSEIQSNLST